MSMFSTLSTFVQTTFTTATKSVESIGKTLDIANHFVDVKHQQVTKIMTNDAQLIVAEHAETLRVKLDADSNLKTQYDNVVAEWNN